MNSASEINSLSLGLQRRDFPSGDSLMPMSIITAPGSLGPYRLSNIKARSVLKGKTQSSYFIGN